MDISQVNLFKAPRKCKLFLCNDYKLFKRRGLLFPVIVTLIKCPGMLG